MNEASTVEAQSGQDGNYKELHDIVPVSEGQDFVYDADGEELRKGDYAIITRGDREGHFVEIEKVSLATIYGGRGGFGSVGPAIKDHWSPSSMLNMASYRDGNIRSGLSAIHMRRVDLSHEQHRELRLRDLHGRLAQLDESIARLHGSRATLLYEIEQANK